MARTSTEALDSYVTDMLALEEHIDKALDGQIAAFKGEHPEITNELISMRGKIATHVDALTQLSREKSSGAMENVAEAVKRVASVGLGLGAAAIDLVRHERLPKDLRDDYTAFSLASVGYLMLHTTAQALGDTSVAAVAERHHAEYNAMSRTLRRIIPGTVVDQLRNEGLPVNTSLVETLEEVFERG